MLRRRKNIFCKLNERHWFHFNVCYFYFESQMLLFLLLKTKWLILFWVIWNRDCIVFLNKQTILVAQIFRSHSSLPNILRKIFVSCLGISWLSHWFQLIGKCFAFLTFELFVFGVNCISCSIHLPVLPKSEDYFGSDTTLNCGMRFCCPACNKLDIFRCSACCRTFHSASSLSIWRRAVLLQHFAIYPHTPCF